MPRIHFEVSPCGNVHPAKTFDYEQSDFGIVEIYTVEVYRDAVKSRLDEDPLNCWSSTKEILSGVDGQERAIDLQQYQFMIQSEAIGRSCFLSDLIYSSRLPIETVKADAEKRTC